MHTVADCKHYVPTFYEPSGADWYAVCVDCTPPLPATFLTENDAKQWAMAHQAAWLQLDPRPRYCLPGYWS